MSLEVNVEDETLKKVALTSAAIALAIMVLPLPGGPNMSCTGDQEGGPARR